MGPKSLLDITTASDSSVARLAREARRREGLLSTVRKALEEEMAVHVTGCNLRTDGTLVVLADTAEWVSRLRFESPRLLSLDPGPGHEIKRVRVRIGAVGQTG